MPNLGPFFVTGLAVGAIYALSGVGLVVLYRASGVLNFAYGAIGATGALLAWQLVEIGQPELVAWLVGVGLATLLSVGYGRVLAPQLAYRDTVVKAVATLGFALVLLGFTRWYWSDDPRKLVLPTDTMGLSMIGVRVTGTRLIGFSLAVLITIGVALFLNRTRLGLSMRALANNRDLSALLGIRVLHVETWAWLISGVLAGLSGLMLGDLVRLDAIVLTFLVIPAMAAAVVGRLRSLAGTLIGGLLIGVLEAVGTPFQTISPYRSVAPFIVAIIVILWLQRQRVITFAGRE
ncbi:MAG TPA: branched-chain amino acid ABC transporter permease [Anaerolineae bacterium]|jgi:branched-chain amino acid transport system permease protein